MMELLSGIVLLFLLTFPMHMIKVFYWKYTGKKPKETFIFFQIFYLPSTAMIYAIEHFEKKKQRKLTKWMYKKIPKEAE